MAANYEQDFFTINIYHPFTKNSTNYFNIRPTD